MAEELEVKIKGLRSQLTENPYLSEVYDELVHLLQLNSTSITEVLEVRYLKNRNFSLSEKDIASFKSDILQINDSDIRLGEYRKFYGSLLAQSPTVNHWSDYLDILIEQGIDITHTGIYKNAIYDCEFDFANAKIIWNKVIAAFVSKDGPFQDILSLYLQRLSRPLEDLNEVSSELSRFVTTKSPETYEKTMVQANKVVAKTSKSLRYYEAFELQIARDPQNIQLWAEYMHQVFEYTAKDIKYPILKTIFYRAIGGHFESEWMSLWLKFIYYLYSIDHKTCRSQLQDFIRMYPRLSVPFAEYIRNLTDNNDDIDEFIRIRDQITKTNLMQTDSYDSWKTLALSILSYEYRYAKDGENLNLVELFYHDASAFTEYALANIDIFHAVEKLVVSIYESLEDLEGAQTLVNSMLQTFPTQCEVWLYALEFKKRHGAPIEDIRRIFNTLGGVITSLDWPERLILEYLLFEQLNGDNASIKASIVLSDKLVAHVAALEKKRPLEDDIEAEVEQKEEEAIEKRQKTSISHNEGKRNREELTIKVAKLPKTITEADLRSFFADCGEPRELLLFEEDDSAAATVEFNSEYEVLAAMTKNLKVVGNSVVNITRFFEATIWLTNYPPSMSHDEIKAMFEEAGNVISIRFPTQNSNKDRRFCYIEYAEPKCASLAKYMFDGKSVKDPLNKREYKLKVELSDPSSKKKRNDLVGNEVYVQSLNFKTVTVQILQEFFEKYGDIVQIRLPLSPNNEEKGYKNNGFAFIAFKSEVGATNALQADGCKLENRAIKVSKSMSKGKRPNHFGDFDDVKSIALFNVNDTLTSQQLQFYLTNEVGEVNKIQLVPEGKAALVEFKKESDSGRASLILNAKSLEGNIMQIGLKRELLNSIRLKKEQKPKTSLMVPTSLRRKNRQ